MSEKYEDQAYILYLVFWGMFLENMHCDERNNSEFNRVITFELVY